MKNKGKIISVFVLAFIVAGIFAQGGFVSARGMETSPDATVTDAPTTEKSEPAVEVTNVIVTPTNSHVGTNPPHFHPYGDGGVTHTTHPGGSGMDGGDPSCYPDPSCDGLIMPPPPEEPIHGGGLPLYSMNPLWNKSHPPLENPSETPTIPTSPPLDPKIIGKADGRHPPVSTMTTTTQAPVQSNPFSGLLSGANAPILGLLVLLVIGIILVENSSKK